MTEASRGLLSIVRSRFERFGDIVYAIDFTGKPIYSIRHPDHIHEVLVARSTDFAKRSKDLSAYLGNGLLTSNGDFWRKQRRRIQPLFRRENMARYADIMVRRAESMVEAWAAGEVRDLNREMMEVTLSVVAKSLLDYDTSSINDGVARAMSIIQETAGFPDPLPRALPTPLHRKQNRAVEELDAIILPIIDACTERREGNDLVSLLKFDEDEDGLMSKKQLRDEIVTMFLAGHETTALSLTWAFYLLSQHPREEAELHEEVDRVLGGRRATFEDLDQLELTKNVVQETMRMFPPLYLLPRVALRDTEIGGYPVKAGSNVLVWTYFVHRDNRWFPAASEFIPRRFEPESRGVLHPHAYMPFGAGPRTCIGKHFAMTESTLMLATIAQRFRPRLLPGQEVRLNARVTLAPQFPIMMELEPRGTGCSPASRELPS